MEVLTSIYWSFTYLTCSFPFSSCLLGLNFIKTCISFFVLLVYPRYRPYVAASGRSFSVTGPAWLWISGSDSAAIQPFSSLWLTNIIITIMGNACQDGSVERLEIIGSYDEGLERNLDVCLSVWRIIGRRFRRRVTPWGWMNAQYSRGRCWRYWHSSYGNVSMYIICRTIRSLRIQRDRVPSFLHPPQTTVLSRLMAKQDTPRQGKSLLPRWTLLWGLFQWRRGGIQQRYTYF